MNAELQRLKGGAGRDLHKLQIKLTYVDSQLKGRASLAFSTFYHLIRMEWFHSLRSADVNYGNDEGDVWSFTVDPDEMGRVVESLSHIDAAARTSDAAVSPHMSLMVVLREFRLGTTAYEAILDVEQSRSASKALRETPLDTGNKVGRKILDLHWENGR